ncbi:MAG TPA: DUF6567 family protein [Cryomorphaceae bacterium]|nr:DUF6567 family protein [Cryomorphaceae bacterium]
MKQISAYLFLLVIMNSCAFHSGMMTGNAELNSNSEIVNFAIGEAKAVYVFGIGGLNSSTLMKDAKEDLYSRYPLKKGQAYANVVVDFRLANFIVFWVNKATISADIVLLDTTKTSEELQIVFKKSEFQAESDLYADLWVQPGDSVFFVRNNGTLKVEVREILWEKKVSVVTEDNRILNARVLKLYTEEKKITFPGIPYKVGDFVQYTAQVTDDLYEQTTAVVKGINPEKILIVYGSEIAEVDPEEISVTN